MPSDKGFIKLITKNPLKGFVHAGVLKLSLCLALKKIFTIE